MKHLSVFAIVLATLLVSANAFSQVCTPNQAFASAPYGIYPYGPIQMDCSGENANVTVVGLTDTLVEFAGISTQMYFDAMRIDSVAGLPVGLVLETDVMGSATASAPYGEWLYTGSQPTFIVSVGCLNITGSPSAWAAASTGGPNNDGVFPLTLVLDYRLSYSDPDISFLIASGSWLSESPTGGVDTVEVLLQVNESACGGSLFVTPQVTANTDTTQGCDGAVTVAVYNGQPPYTYSHSTGAITQTVTGLCPGTYTVDVVDANGLSGSAQFPVGVASNVYSNVNPSGLPSILDSLFGSYQTCDLDYTLPLDSFMIVDALTVGTDTCLVTWVVYQLGQPYTVVTFYPFLGNTPTVFSLTLFCENGRSEVGVFQLYDYRDLSISVGVEEQAQMLDFSVMPNPTSGMLTLVVKEQTAQTQVDVFDPTGKLVLSQNLSGASQKTLDLQHLPDGMYIVRLANETGLGIKRIVKMGGLLTK
jgi:hypothetical protein